MQRAVCLIALFAVSFAAGLQLLKCDNPTIDTQYRPWENGTFSQAGVIRLLKGTCYDANTKQTVTADLDNTKFVLQEKNPYTNKYEGIYSDESFIEWRAIKAVQSLYTFVLVDVSGTQGASFGEVSNVLTNTLKPDLAKMHGQTQVAYFDGSALYFVDKDKKWFDKSDDAIQGLTDKLKDYKILDNSTNFWGALTIAEKMLVDRLNIVSTYNSSNYEQEYANGLLVVLSNFRDTCGCSVRKPVSDVRIQAFSMAIGDDFDNNTYTTWYTNDPFSKSQNIKVAGAVNLNDIKDQTTRNTYVSNQFDAINSSIADDSKGFIAMRYCSPRRGYPQGVNTTSFGFQILYNGKLVNDQYSNNHYNASTFLPGCTLSSAVTVNIFTGLVFFALFLAAF